MPRDTALTQHKAAPSTADHVQGLATTVDLLERACQSANDIVCRAAATCMRYIWRETSRIVMLWLRGRQTFADLMDGVQAPHAACSPTDAAIACYKELVRSLL